MIVVADTSPINYLILLGLVEETLPLLYERVLLTAAVRSELLDSVAPSAVRRWAQKLPAWAEVRDWSGSEHSSLRFLDRGERSAISLAAESGVKVILLDDRRARHVAETNFELQVTGTLGVLRDSHLSGKIDARVAFLELRNRTNFRCDSRTEQLFLASLSL